jgi:hydroxylamine dehydrogenase
MLIRTSTISRLPAGTWTPGTDYRAPTCAACHMSGSGKVMGTHDVTERLSWETQAPLTVRPRTSSPFLPEPTGRWSGRKMKNVCRSCHGDSWINDFYHGFDKAVEEYNEVYFKPAKAKLDELYGKELLDKTKFFDERLELQYYELWHHEGRRARMGVMMMAPDYAWWHGFYECKSRFNEYMEEANHLIETGQKAYVYPNPNDRGHHQTGSPTPLTELTAYPFPVNSDCIECCTCAKVCPVKAITHSSCE